ncbi:MAG TPA: FkbM family methyltransferase [Bacteroidia bacterium]|nr:FkbM family methyltransferase [Bacteroidia bacterium]
MKTILKKIIPASVRNKLKKNAVPVEPESMIEKRKAFYSRFAGKGDLVFDIGANYGNRIEPMHRNGCKVVAVEPQPECVNYLKKKYKDKVTIENVGVGASKGVLDFHISSWSILSTFSDDFIKKTKESGRFSKSSWDKTIKVNLITLDDLIAKHGSPKFIKVDVEGYEEQVFKGLTKKVKYISFEYTLPEFADNLDRILVKLNSIAPIQVNYSVAESMEFELSDWMDFEKFIESFRNDKGFQSKLQDFGDVYVRYLG